MESFKIRFSGNFDFRQQKMEEDKELLYAYQSAKFEENSSDLYSKAAVKRMTMAINYYGSIKMKESNYVTEFLLNDDLEEYSKIVDQYESDIKNIYVDYVKAILSNYQNDDLKYWKSGLDDIDFKEFLEPLSCSNDITCKNADFSEEDLNLFKLALHTYEDTEKTELEEIINKLKGTVPFPQKRPFFEGPESRMSKIVKVPSQPEPSTSKNNEPKESLYFRTARDELQIQNAKKFGKGNSSGNEKGLNYGTVKKTLGTRKGGVFGKFQPPVKLNNDEQQVKVETDEIVDERLRNIDPAMIELIKNEIMDCGSKITWDDIAGLTLAKNTIQEIVVWPMLRPDIFTGLRRPPKGILLFGPPGTGKTLIGKCIASQSNSTFFSISASSLTSKWVGDGEKMVRTLFAVAKVHQPSVVFIDEIDSLLSQRSDSEHECSRRIKTEFLVQLDGAGTGEEDRILIIGATNRPQELDEAARRRLVKRLYIPLPDEDARKQIIQNLISSERHCLTESEIENIAKLTKGYSGADVKNLCQEASLGPIRSIPPSRIQSINPEDVRPLNSKDFESALCRIKSSVSESDLDIYVAWDKQYGCGSIPQSG